jgi:hypothetical protein
VCHVDETHLHSSLHAWLCAGRSTLLTACAASWPIIPWSNAGIFWLCRWGHQPFFSGAGGCYRCSALQQWLQPKTVLVSLVTRCCTQRFTPKWAALRASVGCQWCTAHGVVGAVLPYACRLLRVAAAVPSGPWYPVDLGSTRRAVEFVMCLGSERHYCCRVTNMAASVWQSPLQHYRALTVHIYPKCDRNWMSADPGLQESTSVQRRFKK